MHPQLGEPGFWKLTLINNHIHTSLMTTQLKTKIRQDTNFTIIQEP